ncbi:helix-turn-helix domain-containing protein [Streptomyces sp. MNU76]|uniref:helix-turn-helix domain-containing protein n=1 Tax=Streptomyces sp. MNU76 TaxID=2560026 RepID=UPI0035A83EEF
MRVPVRAVTTGPGMRIADGGDGGDGGETMSIQGDADEFAALLRRLKDRTDRSYGSLARRLNMNTSTLHRYCAGDAVPQDYAPVERLAAFCGATPQERLELHRLWLSAVAARQRVRTAEAPEEEIPSPAPTASEEENEDAHTHAHADTDETLAGQSGPAEHPGDHPDPDVRSPPPLPAPSLVPPTTGPGLHSRRLRPAPAPSSASPRFRTVAPPRPSRTPPVPVPRAPAPPPRAPTAAPRTRPRSAPHLERRLPRLGQGV